MGYKLKRLFPPDSPTGPANPPATPPADSPPPLVGPELAQIIFVHDLAGHALKTWQSQKPPGFWTAQNFPNTTGFAFRYDTRDLKTLDDLLSKDKLEEHANALINKTKLYRSSKVERPNAILVGHGYGGLICEQAVINMNENKNRKSRISGILLFGTPHFGAGLAQWALLSAREIKLEGYEKTAMLPDWSKYTEKATSPEITENAKPQSFWSSLAKQLPIWSRSSNSRKDQKDQSQDNQSDQEGQSNQESQNESDLEEQSESDLEDQPECDQKTDSNPDDRKAEKKKELDAIADMQKTFCRKYIDRKQPIKLACCFSENVHPRTGLQISPEWCILPRTRPILMRSSHHFDMTNLKSSQELLPPSFRTVEKVITRWINEPKPKDGTQARAEKDEPQRADDPSRSNDPAYGQARSLMDFAANLSLRYEQTGSLHDLDSAIQAVEQALYFTPEDDPDRTDGLSYLGNKLEDRYERRGDAVDLEEAIQVAKQALQLTPAGHLNRADRLNNLASKLTQQYKRRQELADLEHAIHTAQEAIMSTSEHDPNRAKYLSSLATILGHKYEHTSNRSDIEAAIRLARKAVITTSENHPNRAMYLNILGNLLGQQSENPDKIQDLNEAIHILQDAVDLTPEQNIHRAGRLYNLGAMFERRYERMKDKDETDLERSSSLFLSSWNCDTGNPFRRIQAATRAVKCFAQRGDLEQASKIAQDAIDFLPRVSNRSLHLSDQEHALSYFDGLASLACSIFLRLQNPTTALEILEKGRTTIIHQLMGDRSDVSTLRQEYPESAHQLERLLDEINTPLPNQNDAVRLQQAQQRRRHSIAAFDSCVKEIRRFPGYERIFLGLTVDEMQKCAKEDLIVVVNVSELCSHAIIISFGNIQWLELPDFSPQTVQNRLGRQLGFTKDLAWLWDVCVAKVVNCCELRAQRSMDDLRRIWWIGSGLASSFPFHAAGDHSPGSDNNLFDKAVSSYTLSIKTLAYSRNRLLKNNSKEESMLLATSFPGIEAEQKQILKILPAHCQRKVLVNPSPQSIMEELEHCTMAHFACFAVSNPFDPSRSGLNFQPDDISELLTVQNVSELKLENAKIAYLSACSTAENKGAKLRDEAISIVSGFQVAGFPHVVGVLGMALDDVCVKVAKSFYETLFRGTNIQNEIEDRDVALALHTAVLTVRERDWTRPEYWAYFVHYGP